MYDMSRYLGVYSEDRKNYCMYSPTSSLYFSAPDALLLVIGAPVLPVWYPLGGYPRPVHSARDRERGDCLVQPEADLPRKN